MPEKFGHGRYNSENNYGANTTSAKKRTKKTRVRGCPGNNDKEHYYVVSKEIRIWTERDNHESVWHNIYCLFCGKKLSYRKSRRNNPTQGYEVIDTFVLWMGKNVPGKFGSIYILKQRRFNGNTDKTGKKL